VTWKSRQGKTFLFSDETRQGDPMLKNTWQDWRT